MKKSEVNAALAMPTASANVKELNAINAELSRVKYLLKSISGRKLEPDDEVSDEVSALIKNLNKIRLGGIIKKSVTLQLFGTDRLGKESKRVESYICKLTACTDKLLFQLLKLIKSFKRETIKEINITLGVILEYVKNESVKNTFDKALAIVASAETDTESSENAPQSNDTNQMNHLSSETDKRGTEQINEQQRDVKQEQSQLPEPETTYTHTSDRAGVTYYVDPEYRAAM